MPPPVPPSVNDGRMIAGKSGRARRIASASSKLSAMPPGGDGEPDALPSLRRTACGLRRCAIASRGRADQLDAVLLERAGLRQRHRDVERRLAAHRRENRVRPLLLEDQLDELRRHRLDVRPIRELRIGHDRRRVGVDEDDLVALFLERFRRLRARVVELGGLPDDDRAGADHENSMQVSPSRHVRASRR